jgi:phosphoglycolate phosphatase-like HAD superfamily hydrolase
VSAALVVSDAAFADADAVFAAAVAYLARKYAAIQTIDVAALPADRAAAIRMLDDAAPGGWRVEFARFFEAHAPVVLRPDPALNSLLRAARRRGVRIAVVSPLPADTAGLYLAQLGVARLVDVVIGEEAGDGLTAARLAIDAPGAELVATRAQLESTVAALA